MQCGYIKFYNLGKVKLEPMWPAVTPICLKLALWLGYFFNLSLKVFSTAALIVDTELSTQIF